MIKRLLPGIVAVTFLTGCSDDRPGDSRVRPRIVSFSPALTQILFDMALGDHVVAVTTQCMLPPGQNRPTVGDALHADAEGILAVKPDVVLIQMKKSEELESVRRVNPKIRIEHFEIESLDDVARAIERIGRIVGKPGPAAKVAGRFAEQLDAVRRRVWGLPRPRALFVIGHERPFVPGKGTFVHDMIELAGGVNAGDPGQPHRLWRSADIEEIMAARPDVVICEAQDDQQDRARDYWLRVPGLPAAEAGRVHVVTDRRWTIPSTYSPVLAGRLAAMLHPEPAAEGTGP